MRFAIFSDLHDNAAALRHVLTDAERCQADRLICLGDVGHDLRLLAAVQARKVSCAFGNWEVSGLRRLPSPLAEWVGAWPAVIRCGRAIFCHATPDMPAAVTNTAAAARYMASSGAGWLQLFPRLHRDEEARWQAFAALESGDLRVAFHGHTHVQMIWAWQTIDGVRKLHSFATPAEFVLEAGATDAPNRYLVGVGSAGQPDDGPQLRYALYDDATQRVVLRRLDSK